MTEIDKIDFQLFSKTPLPKSTQDIGMRVTILPCVTGTFEMPPRTPSLRNIISTFESQCSIAPEERKTISFLFPPLTLFIRVQTSLPRKFVIGIASRILSINDRNNISADNANWQATYSGATTDSHVCTVEDFMKIEVRVNINSIHPGCIVVVPGINDITHRIEAWDEGNLVGWTSIRHRIKRNE